MDLLKLVDLQKIDKRLMELEQIKGDLPDQIEDIKSRLFIMKEEFSKTMQDMEDTKQSIRANERDRKSLADKLKKFQDQLYSVKTNKEYDAITHEIETVEQHIEQAELNGVELLEQEEELTKDVVSLTERVSELEQHLDKKEIDLQNKLNQTEAEQKVLMSARNNIVPSIDRRLLATYERIRKGKGGIALAEIKNYICNACFTTIPAQTVVEVRKMEKLISCEVCGRILIAFNNRVEKPIASELGHIQSAG